MGVNEKVVDLLIKNGITITTMESCTAGALISTITDVEGSSAITEGGYVTYSNRAKIEAGVLPEIIAKYGVYSQETANNMAETCRKNKDADIGIGVTGTFSNVDTNNADSRPGEVYVSIIYNDSIQEYKIVVPIMERRLQKNYVVNIILNNLLELLEELKNQ